VQAAAQHHGFSAAWGRLFLPYGAGDPPQRLVPTVLAALVARAPVETTHGNQTRDFIDARDAADLLVHLLMSSETGAFNIGTGKETTVNELFATLAELTGSRFKENHGPAKPGEQRRSVLECSAAKRELDWTPQTSLRDGLERTVEYFRGTDS